LVVDIDGTLIGKDGRVTTADRDALSRVRGMGVVVSLTTGRVLQSCVSILHQVTLDCYHIFFDGALVTNIEHTEEIFAKYIDPALVEEVVILARELGLNPELYSVKDYFVEAETPLSDIRRRFFALEPVVGNFNGLWERERIIKVGLVATSPGEMERVSGLSSGFNRRLRFSTAKTPAYPDLTFVNISAPEVSKGIGLKTLAWHLGVPLSRVMAIGDDENDIDLLKLAGLSVAMASAPPEVKAAASHVTLDQAHGGVAAAISRFLL